MRSSHSIVPIESGHGLDALPNQKLDREDVARSSHLKRAEVQRASYDVSRYGRGEMRTTVVACSGGLERGTEPPRGWSGQHGFGASARERGGAAERGVESATRPPPEV